MFKEEPNRKIAEMQEQAQSEVLQKICDILVAAGYFRARLNIDPFDKILGGICWSIAGSNQDIDIEFHDDLNMGQKIKLSEKVVAALKQMDCPLSLSPHQIQGLDYERIYPVIQWLVKKLMESRDTRGDQDENQQAKQQVSQELERLKEIVFKGKPKRVYRTNKNRDVAFQDPKRVHTALREFNDMSASKIAQFENEEKARQMQFQKPTSGSQTQNKQGTTNTSKAETIQQQQQLQQQQVSQSQTQEEVIANVERMLQQEKESQKTLPKTLAFQEFDLNEGIVTTSPNKIKKNKQGPQIQQTQSQTIAGQNVQETIPQKQVNQQVAQQQTVQQQMNKPLQGKTTEQELINTQNGYQIQQNVDKIIPKDISNTENQFQQEDDAFDNLLSNDIAPIQRQTLAVKTNNVSEAFMSNIESISETVQGFQKMSEETFQHDATFYFQSEKENYERQIQKLKGRIEKQQKQQVELQKILTEVTQEVDQLEYEREQYLQQVNIVQQEAEQIDQKVEKSAVKEHEIMVVTALIDEKARLQDEKIQLKKNCRDEKTKLDQELEKMRKKRDEMEKQEHAEILRQIDSEFDAEHNKLLEQRKLIAEQNKNINVYQRKIQNCPSKIEITQFHKRFVELFDNLNLKSEENRRYVNLFNTVMETKRLFKQQCDYMREINDSYKNCKGKKEKEVLLHNIQNILNILDKNITISQDNLNKMKSDAQRVQQLYNDSILKEKDHFRRIKEFEDECDKNGELRAKLQAKK